MLSGEDVQGWISILPVLLENVENRPLTSGVIFLAIVIVLILFPGGVGTKFLELRKARRELDHARDSELMPVMEALMARVERISAKATHKDSHAVDDSDKKADGPDIEGGEK